EGLDFFQASVDPDVVYMTAAVREDGTAEWAVEYRVRLDDDNATRAFESVQADIEDDPDSFTARFADGMARTVASAENATGREMALESVTVSAERQTFGQEYGVVTYRFTWTAFATTDGDRIRAGDALAELFLDEETTLEIAYPEGYEVASVQPRPSENRSSAVVWRGPIDFGADEPRVAVAPGAAGGSQVPLLAGVALVLVAVAGGAVLLARRRGTGEGAVDAAAAGATGTDGTGAATGTGTAADDGGEEPPEELLSNEERVIKLLDESGGRIKQQRIAEAFDWTDAKTSQVVGTLRDDDAVETFRIGRENVVTLPEESDLLDDDP
ncbi:hypothetical protein BRC78_01460, partial [Halobacteriales archaeon QH_8_68_33]